MISSDKWSILNCCIPSSHFWSSKWHLVAPLSSQHLPHSFCGLEAFDVYMLSIFMFHRRSVCKWAVDPQWFHSPFWLNATNVLISIHLSELFGCPTCAPSQSSSLPRLLGPLWHGALHPQTLHPAGWSWCFWGVRCLKPLIASLHTILNIFTGKDRPFECARSQSHFFIQAKH